jgi:hypothetical protein
MTLKVPTDANAHIEQELARMAADQPDSGVTRAAIQAKNLAAYEAWLKREAVKKNRREAKKAGKADLPALPALPAPPTLPSEAPPAPASGGPLSQLITNVGEGSRARQKTRLIGWSHESETFTPAHVDEDGEYVPAELAVTNWDAHAEAWELTALLALVFLVPTIKDWIFGSKDWATGADGKGGFRQYIVDQSGTVPAATGASNFLSFDFSKFGAAQNELANRFANWRK